MSAGIERLMYALSGVRLALGPLLPAARRELCQAGRRSAARHHHPPYVGIENVHARDVSRRGAPMSQPTLAGIHHVKIPVTELNTSRAWYERVFGFRVTMEFPDADDLVVGVSGEVPGLGDVLLALRVNPAAAGGSRGFDPVSFGVTGRKDVEAWAEHLDALDIEHSPVIDASLGWLLVFTDPDGLELHLYSWARHSIDQAARPGYGRASRRRRVEGTTT